MSTDPDADDRSATPREGADRSGSEDRNDHGGRPCPRCGEPMYHRHCKYVCPVHGVVFDCADTFY